MTQGFPEDQFWGAYGTNDGDVNDAASFGALAHSSLPTSAIIDGLTMIHDRSDDTFDLEPGTIRFVGTNVPGDGGTTWDHAVRVYEVDAITGHNLDDNATNHIFLEADNTAVDSVNLKSNTTNTPPSGPSHKLGEINTSNNVTSGQWGLLSANGVLTYPSETAADVTATGLPEGTIVYDRSTDEHYFVN